MQKYVKGAAPAEGRRFLPAVVLLFVAIGTQMHLAQTAAVMDMAKQQLLVDTTDGSSEGTYGGCDDGRVVNCHTLPLFNYTELSASPSGSDASGDILQDNNCPSNNLQRHLRCVDVFTRRCMTSDQRRAFYSLYTVPTLDMQEMCTENSPYREDYLRHAPCLRTVHAGYMECGRKHQNELSALMSDHGKQQNGPAAATSAVPFTGPEQMNQNLANLCKSFSGHLKCVQGIVRAKCGKETEEFANQFLSQMASSLLNICDKYVNLANSAGGDDGSAASSGATSISGTSMMMTTAAVLATAATVCSVFHRRR